MNLQKLVEVLKKQEMNLVELKKSSLEKQSSLVKNDVDGITTAVFKEERNLLSIQLTEEDRLEIMSKLFKEFNIDKERFKLSILLQELDGKINDKIVVGISQLEDRMKRIIKEVTKINGQNMMLVQQSKSLINETIQAVISNSKTILDRKG